MPNGAAPASRGAVAGSPVAFFGTAPGAQHRAHRSASGGGARRRGRTRLGQPGRPRSRCGASCETVDADVFVVELKAAAVDVVAEARRERAAWSVVLAANDVVPLAGEPDLDAELQRLAAESPTRW